MFKQQNKIIDMNLNRPGPLSQRLRFEVEQTLNRLYADASLVDQLDRLYLPFSSWLSQKAHAGQGPLVVGVGGAQGCGKTTFCSVISRILNKGFDLNCIVLSLDDLYSTRHERLKFAHQTTQMFAVRGVPGTHDVDFALSLFDRLKNLKEGEVMKFPCFDKSIDDRKAVHLWQEVQGPVDVVLFEGWCVGAPPMHGDIQRPINMLEAEMDADCTWRNKVNQLLKEDYKKLFSKIDLMAWMQAPDYEVVYHWRNKQERMLESHLHDIHGILLDTIDLKVMSSDELKRFMQYYERLTRHMLAVMPERADVLFRLNREQDVVEMRFPVEH
jgi:D-glycerate 3-kinase